MIKLSPSTLERYALCPGAYWAEKGMPFTESAIQDEGKILHAVMAGTAKVDGLTRTQKADVAFCSTAGRQLVKDHLGACTFYTEKYLQVKLSHDVMLTGLADWFGYRHDPEPVALVIDWKFGRIAQEEAASNLQVRAYAVMAAMECAGLGTGVVNVALVQPRVDLDNRITVCRYEPKDILAATEEICDIAKAIEYQKDSRAPGEKQCRYCKALGTSRCPESTEQARQLAPLALVDVLPSGTQLAKMLDVAAVAEDVIARLKDHAKERLAAGDTIPGWELHRNAPIRTIPDAEKAWGKLQAVLDPEEFMGIAKVGVTDLQNAVADKKRWTTRESKEAFNALMGDAIVWADKAPTLKRSKTAADAA